MLRDVETQVGYVNAYKQMAFSHALVHTMFRLKLIPDSMYGHARDIVSNRYLAVLNKRHMDSLT